MPFLDTPNQKFYASENYNYYFNKQTGFFRRWGKTAHDDPEWAPFPELADIEISEVCGKGCPPCYKNNTLDGKNMSLETFKDILNKLPPQICQIAFGIGDVDSHPQMFDIFEHTRSKGIIPNVTINGSRTTNEIAAKLAKVCGAVAVSHYNDDECFNTIEMLSKAGLDQINIHKLLCEESYEDCFRLIDLVKKDPQAKNLNAIVFLLLKNKGRGITLTSLKSLEKYKKLINYAISKEINLGFDSCSALNFLKAIEGHPKEKEFITYVEPCESTNFSFYIDVEGNVMPCSFSEGEKDIIPISMLSIKDFNTEVWFSDQFVKFRQNKKIEKTSCILFDLDMK